MKRCRIIHINDGNPETINNGDWMFVESYTRAERILEEYINDGYEVKQMIPDITPADAGGFYKTGFTVYLEKES